MFSKKLYFKERVSCGSFALIQPRACTLPNDRHVTMCLEPLEFVGKQWEISDNNRVVSSLGARAH